MKSIYGTFKSRAVLYLIYKYVVLLIPNPMRFYIVIQGKPVGCVPQPIGVVEVYGYDIGPWLVRFYPS